MLSVYGVANHTPDQLIRWLLDIQTVEIKDILPLRPTYVLKETQRNKLRPYILLMSARDLKRNLELLNTLEDTCVFVFDSALTLWEYEGLMPLDFGESENPQLDGIETYDYFLELSDEGFHVSHNKNNNYLDVALGMINDTESLLRPLMTFIYTMPSSTHQKPVKFMMCLSLYSGISDKKLIRVIDYLDRTVGLPAQKKQKLTSLMLSGEAAKYKAAFKEFRSNKAEQDVDLLCLNRKISSYEFKYIQSIVKKSKNANGENYLAAFKEGIK